MTDKENPFPDTKFKEFTFSKADMTAAKFNGVNLTDSHFWAVLKNAQFKDCNLQAAEFYDVNLSESSFEDINLSNSTFNNINLSGVSFSNLNMSNVEITAANLEGMKIDGVLVTELFEAHGKTSQSGDTPMPQTSAIEKY